MDRIHSLISTARQRLMMEAWLSAALKAGALVGVVLLALVLERRLTAGSARFGLPSGSDGPGVWAAVAIVAVLAAVLFGAWRARRATRSVLSAALEVDSRIASGERFTTALQLEGDADPFARAAVADAISYASAPAVATAVREKFAIKAPQRWWAAPAALGLALAVWVAMPQYSIFGAPDAEKNAADDAAANAPIPEKARLNEMVKAIESSPELAKALQAELEQAKHAVDPGADTRKLEEQAREALRRMAELQQRLEEMKNTKEAKAAEALKDALAQLQLPEGKNAASDLAEALKRGDYKDAKQALEKLQQAIKDDKLSDQARQDLAKALDQTAKQLDALAKDPQKLQDALKNAGMDPELAKNAQALQQAIQQSQQLNQTQKDQLQKMAQSMQQCQQQLNQMSSQMNQMSSACQNPGNSGQGQQGKSNQGQQSQAGSQQQGDQSGQAGDQMSSMLSEAEASEAMSRACDNANSQCNGGKCMSEGEADSVLRSSCRGDSECNGSSSGQGEKDGNKGGHGQARGGNRETKATQYNTKIQHTKGQRSEGDVIARQLVEGESPVGESRVKLEQVAGEIAPGYENGSEDEPIPAHLAETHKQYFGKLRKAIESRGVKVPAKQSETAAAPAKPAAGGAK